MDTFQSDSMYELTVHSYIFTVTEITLQNTVNN